MQNHPIHDAGRWCVRSARAAAAAAALIFAFDSCTISDNSITEPSGPTPWVSVELPSASLVIAQGGVGSIAINVSRGGGYAGPVSLSVANAPPGITPTLEPAIVSAGVSTTTLTLTAANTIPPGTYSLMLTVSGTGCTPRSASLSLTVTTSGSISISLASAAATAFTGGSVSVPITVSRGGGFAGPVTMTVMGLGAGMMTATFDPGIIPAGVSNTTLTISVTSSATPGTYPLTIIASGSGVASRSAPLSLTVAIPVTAISVFFVPEGESVFTVLGDSWTWPGVTVTRGLGYTGPVGLTIEGLPAGVTATFNPAVLNPGVTKSEVTFTAATNAQTGVAMVTIRARGEGVPDATTQFRFFVVPPAG